MIRKKLMAIQKYIRRLLFKCNNPFHPSFHIYLGKKDERL
jgi:hypothetical protein